MSLLQLTHRTWHEEHLHVIVLEFKTAGFVSFRVIETMVREAVCVQLKLCLYAWTQRKLFFEVTYPYFTR